jgi:hypothetical protein
MEDSGSAMARNGPASEFPGSGKNRDESVQELMTLEKSRDDSARKMMPLEKGKVLTPWHGDDTKNVWSIFSLWAGECPAHGPAASWLE